MGQFIHIGFQVSFSGMKIQARSFRHGFPCANITEFSNAVARMQRLADKVDTTDHNGKPKPI